MHDRSKDAGEHRIAAATVIVVHLLLGWLLLRIGAGAPPADEAPSALQVVWIEPHAQALRSTPRLVPAEPNRPGTAARTVANNADRRDLATLPEAALNDGPVPAVATDAAVARLPLSVTFIEQAQAFARDAASVPIVAADPLADRNVSLPRADRGQFRMRHTMTVGDVAQGIAVLFAGPGYTTDPCPQIDGNLANLGTGGDTELMREELRRKRDYCH